MDSLAFHRFAVLIQEDLKVQPFADEITKATLSPQLFKDPECWSGRTRTQDLPRELSVRGELLVLGTSANIAHLPTDLLIWCDYKTETVQNFRAD